MKKTLFAFLGIATLVGGLQLISTTEQKKAAAPMQCCGGGCSCDNGNGDRDDK